MMKRIISLCVSVVLLLAILPNAYASTTVLQIDKIVCDKDTTVDVPIRISGNTGIAGAVIKIFYDNNLALTDVKRGDAFGKLTFTPPAKMTSNPITLLWDGIDEDNSNGVIAILTFKVPNEANGNYRIYATYDTGGIYDGNLNDIDLSLIEGGITISNEEQVSEIDININSQYDIKLPLNQSEKGNVYIALYVDLGKLFELKIYPISENIVSQFSKINSGKRIKVMCWDNETLQPQCNSVEINL